MKIKDYIGVSIIVGFAIILFFAFQNNNSLQNDIFEKNLEIKKNLYKIDSLMYHNDILQEQQDTLEQVIKKDSILLVKKQKGINYLYNKLKKQNEEINNSSSIDDYQYLLNITK